MRARWALALTCAGFWWPLAARAQIDPILFLKKSDPAVIIALDLSSRMQRDLSGRYLDPFVYRRTGAAWEAAIGVTAANTASLYRRRYAGLAWLDPGGPDRAVAAAIETVGDLHEEYARFDARGRLSMARAALIRAIDGNCLSVRFGLVVGRQAAPRFQRDPPVSVTLEGADPTAPTDTGLPGSWSAVLGAVDPEAGAPAGGVLVRADAAGATRAVLARLTPGGLDPGALVSAGLDRASAEDAPLSQLVDDLREEAARLVAADATCRNTVAVLVTGGGQSPPGEGTLASRAAPLLRVAGRRVPLYVVGLGPRRAESEALRDLAAAAGGRYFEIPPADGPLPDVESVVSAVTAAVNAAVQHAFARFADVNAAPSPERPVGPLSEFPTSAPVVGTVDLQNLVSASGLLPLTRVVTPSGDVVPQQSNVLFTAGFVLPGFHARVRAFRVYRPEADAASATGYRFVADGTLLWTAEAPPPASRNVFTVLPGRGVVPFDVGQVEALAPFLRSPDPAGLVAAIRAHPLGAVTSSTPALLTPPVLPAVDEAALAFVAAHRDRRALLFVGLDDGMMHAFDARTGLEVWALIPFNLLPRLRFLLDGQPIDGYRCYVGGSPRLADVVSGGEWRTLLVFGEAAGGTFYQAFDVTLEGMAAAIPPAADPRLDLLGWFANPRRIPFLWSFPAYAHFDAALGEDGDVAAAATDLEKSVGQTWSTPAIFGLQREVPSLALVGSGPLPASIQRAPNRGGIVAGTRAYLLEARTGAVLDAEDVGSDGEGEEQDGCPKAGCVLFKNALAADPVVLAGPAQPPRAYLGDLDGRLWRLEVEGREHAALAGPRRLFSVGGRQPLIAPVALLGAGAGSVYLFFGTGSDQLRLAADRPASRIVTLLDSPSGVSPVSELLLESAGEGGRDERLSALPAAGGSVVFFSATAGGPGGCEPDEARLYALNVPGGTAFDTTGDGRRDARDSPRVASLAAGRATPPAVADRHLYVGAGDRIQALGDPAGFNAGPGFVGVRILSWREVGKTPDP